ncbi:Prephenate dehydratase protein [Dioscorea alata]|uniref:Prephenate dehydratase protein n=1 Tax=Dioscorea alata TaxID=55571 RepID=A0ACB7WCQ9_DIOAL|nr:Prephenate dehydratase protein [Dioscorea alata]
MTSLTLSTNRFFPRFQGCEEFKITTSKFVNHIGYNKRNVHQSNQSIEMAAASLCSSPNTTTLMANIPTKTKMTNIRCSQQAGSNRITTLTDWQSSCAILTGKVNHSISSLPFPPALTPMDLVPFPKHGCKLRVAYRGVPGAYTEAAAGKAYPDCEPIPCDQFDVVFQAVEQWVADRAILPVENSSGGTVHRNYDLLLRHRLHIVGEIQMSVHHCLLALPGVRKENLTRVISHPQALSQCEHTLTSLGLDVSREAFDDTAGAAEHVAAEMLRDTGVIASVRAAELYGMEILAEGIEDDKSGNVTRFVMLAREPVIPRRDGDFKTSIVFAGEEGPSFLFKVLSALAFRDIRVTKLESRPHKGCPLRQVNDGLRFDYMYYVDFEASMAETRVQNALSEINEYTSFLRLLGSYPMVPTDLKS